MAERELDITGNEIATLFKLAWNCIIGNNGKKETLTQDGANFLIDLGRRNGFIKQAATAWGLPPGTARESERVDRASPGLRIERCAAVMQSIPIADKIDIPPHASDEWIEKRLPPINELLNGSAKLPTVQSAVKPGRDIKRFDDPARQPNEVCVYPQRTK
jgi:hypothetical protein